MRFSQGNRFKFTGRHIETEAFYSDADVAYAEDKLYEYNKNNIAVYDYVVAKDQGCYDNASVLLRIIKPRYQIAYKDEGDKIYYAEDVYNTFKQARLSLDKMLLDKELLDTREYYVKTISYLDEQI